MDFEWRICLSTCLPLVFLLFSWPSVLLLSHEKLKRSLGCVIVACVERACVCACVFVCDQTHTDRWRTDRKARFIYRFALSFTVLFWRTGRSCPHCSTMTSHALRHVSLNESLSPVFLPRVDFPGNLSETFEFETSNPLLDFIGVQQTPSRKVTMHKCAHLYVH